MTKAKARLRAKAKAGQKTKKREASANQPVLPIRPGQFDPKDKSISPPGAKANIQSFAGARRGAPRSR